MKILIVEDEERAASRLCRMITEVYKEAEFMAVLDSVEEIIEWFKEGHKPDLVFLDIQLSDGNSFDAFDYVQFDCPIIFTTAYEEYSLRAFEQFALDYLLKPIKMSELERAFKKYTKSALSKSGGIPTPKSGVQLISERRLLLRNGNKMRACSLHEIAYFYSQDRISFCTMLEGNRFPTSQTLEKLESELPEVVFFRANRKFIIQRGAVRDFDRYSKGRYKLNLLPSPDELVLVSAARVSGFKDWMQGR